MSNGREANSHAWSLSRFDGRTRAKNGFADKVADLERTKGEATKQQLCQSSGDSHDGRYSPIERSESRQSPTFRPDMQLVSQNMWMPKLPKGGYLQSPFEDLRYGGKDSHMNPMAFVRRFENIATREEMSAEDRLYWFLRCLKQTAASWFESHDFESIEKALSQFKERFWNQSAQDKIRRQLYTGKFEAGKQKSMAQNVLEMNRQMKMLDAPVSDKKFISNISRHFDHDTAIGIRPGTINDVRQLVEYLTYQDADKEACEAERKTRDRTSKKYGTAPVKSTQNREWRGLRDRGHQDNKSTYKSYKKDYSRKESRSRSPSQTCRDNYRKDKDPEPTMEMPTSSNKDKKKKESKDKKLKAEKQSGRSASRRRQYSVQTKKTAAIKELGSDTSSGFNSDSESSHTKEIGFLKKDENLKDLEEFTREEQAKTRNRVSARIPIKIGNKECKALIDTGSQINAMSTEFFEELVGSGVEAITILINKFTLRGAFTDKGDLVSYKTAIEVTIKDFTYVVDFYIIKKLLYDVIVGMKFLARHRAVINCVG